MSGRRAQPLHTVVPTAAAQPESGAHALVRVPGFVKAPALWAGRRPVSVRAVKTASDRRPHGHHGLFQVAAQIHNSPVRSARPDPVAFGRRKDSHAQRPLELHRLAPVRAGPDHVARGRAGFAGLASPWSLNGGGNKVERAVFPGPSKLLVGLADAVKRVPTASRIPAPSSDASPPRRRRPLHESTSASCTPRRVWRSCTAPASRQSPP